MAKNTQAEYDELKEKHANLQAEMEKLKGSESGKSKPEERSAGDVDVEKNSSKNASKDAMEHKDENKEAMSKIAMENEDLKKRMAALEKEKEDRDAADKQALAERLASIDISTKKIPDSKFDDQVKMHMGKSAAELRASLTYAEDLAKNKNSSFPHQASVYAHVAPSNFQDDPNEAPNRQASESGGLPAARTLRRQMYG